MVIGKGDRGNWEGEAGGGDITSVAIHVKHAECVSQLLLPDDGRSDVAYMHQQCEREPTDT